MIIEYVNTKTGFKFFIKNPSPLEFVGACVD